MPKFEIEVPDGHEAFVLTHHLRDKAADYKKSAYEWEDKVEQKDAVYKRLMADSEFFIELSKVIAKNTKMP